jgi:hypothetical protein
MPENFKEANGAAGEANLVGETGRKSQVRLARHQKKAPGSPELRESPAANRGDTGPIRP